QSTLKGVYRFLVLSIVTYLLSHWAYLWSDYTGLPDWGELAAIARSADAKGVSHWKICFHI
ncbi:MAG: hypothetical protein KME46_28220, partial [Brasilonema angustatum HA4187-MV1]|nr:hypothetical protein [Brasilonema angustatum HA4187-MV1]